MQPIVDLLPLFMREFALCRVREGELVALLTDPRTRPEYTAAAGAAAAALGAQVFEISVRGQGWGRDRFTGKSGMGVAALARPSELLDVVRDALSRVQLLVDLIPNTIIHVPLRDELKRAGCRILTIVEPPDALERMFPAPEITEAVEALRTRLATARTLTATSEAGTSLTYDLTETTANGQVGYADEPGRWDHWPSALVTAYPVDGSARGTLVLAVGDVVLPFPRYVEAPVTLQVEGGYVVDIQGGLDAELIRDYLESFDDKEVYCTSHIGFGMHPQAQWDALALYDRGETMGMDARCFRGGFLVSTGPNRFTGRYLDAHLDMPLRGCTVTLDGESVLDAGRLVESQLARA
jgi:2,5-dihydroxypyridine 5,6-dioxygenase